MVDEFDDITLIEWDIDKTATLKKFAYSLPKYDLVSSISFDNEIQT